MYEDIVYEVTDPVAVIRLNRPERLNAFRTQTMREIRDAVRQASADERVVGIVITGTGRGFCAGLDSADLQRAADPNNPPRSAGSPDSDELPALFSYLLDVPKPVIAAVNGVCAGGGFVLAMMCDLRFAAEDATFTTVFSRRGLISEHGTSWLFPRIVGVSQALDLLWSSRRVEAAEALSLGFVNRVVAAEDLRTAAEAYVRDLAETTAPSSLKAMKQLVYRHLGTTFPVAAVEADQAMQDCVAGVDFREGVAAFVEKRSPRFQRLGDKS